MKCFNSSKLTNQYLENVIRVLCSEIERQVNFSNTFLWTEYALRRELVACILGSQVRYEMAVSMLERIEQAGLLTDEWWERKEDEFESRVFDLLSNRCSQYNNWRYRFPKVRAHQLMMARDAVAQKSLSERLSDNLTPKKIRQQLVEEIPGIGPKQASMFIRNIGLSYDIAILDAHVLNFMNMQNLLYYKNTNISTLQAYEHIEQIIIDYANSLGYPVGYLDWAIWATMRAIKELGI